MLSKSLFIAAVSSTLAFAQYGGYGGGGDDSSSSTTQASQAVPSAPADTPGHVNIDVAFDGRFEYRPTNVTASNGTLVTFYFPNAEFSHSVTQSSFANPCNYLTANGSTPGGFDSGLQKGTQFTINITDDTKREKETSSKGMVGSINAPTTGDNTYEAFQAAARALGSNAPTETDNGPVTGGVNGIATATPAATATAEGDSDDSDGAIGLKGVFSGLAVLCAAFVVSFLA